MPHDEIVSWRSLHSNYTRHDCHGEAMDARARFAALEIACRERQAFCFFIVFLCGDCADLARSAARVPEPQQTPVAANPPTTVQAPRNQAQ